ncbi:MAG: ImmA/IrrE family metallo-endopeptidase [Chloroflexi bacterium]|nr:ImmA/IrrE family metallo-endopeptidase [Chloroflexota bacterium]MCL5074872.1 ImmA/IrrE family metallo-endopeptidase [Chloroflexota bacterium]
MTRVTISEPVLRWAMERSGSPGAVARKFPKLPEWLSGKSRPTLRQLEELAKATSTPLGYLFLSEPPQERLPVPHFRTLGDEPLRRSSPDLLETIQMMERRQAWMREYLTEQGHEPLSFVRSARLTDIAEGLAREMRRTLGLAQGWTAQQSTWTEALRELQSRIEEAGILVVVNSIVGNNPHRKLNVTEFRGFILVDEYAPLVFVNGADSKAAQMFTLAHELAHIWFGSSAAFDLRELQPADDETERACSQVAAEFLVPRDELQEMWPFIKQGPDPFQAIARQFKVSEVVGARKALDLGLITKHEFLDFYVAYQQAERSAAARGQEGGNFYATQNLRLGRRFAEAVMRAVREGNLLYREAYELTGLYGQTFERYGRFLASGALV